MTFIVLTFERTSKGYVLQVVGLVSLAQDTARSKVLVLSLPSRYDIHAYQNVGQRRTSHVLAETGHAVAVTRQGAVQPQVADLGSLAQTAEETAHTLSTSAGVAVQVGSNGNLVTLCIERAYIGVCELHIANLLADAADEAVAVGAVSRVVNVCRHDGIQTILAGIHTMSKEIQLLG